VRREDLLRETVRKDILPRIGKAVSAPPEAGLYQAKPEELGRSCDSAGSVPTEKT
jgi:hypothetical protein